MTEHVHRLRAIARFGYRDDIPNVQVSWVKLGINGARQLLAAGVNDLIRPTPGTTARPRPSSPTSVWDRSAC